VSPGSTRREPSGAHSHADHRSDGHGHAVGPDADGRYITISLALILCFMLFEVTAGLVGHSLVLLADAGHMLTDAAALIATLVALRLARRPASGVWTFGLKRAEVLSAQANGITLLVVGALVAFEAVLRLLHPVTVRGSLLIIVAAVGVVVNGLATLALGRANRGSINLKGAFRHIVTDLYAFVGTLVAGIVILASGFREADSIASLFVVVLMVTAAWGLLHETGRVLLEAAPVGYDPEVIARDIVANPLVESVHDVHVWLITSGFPAMSGHVLVKGPADCHAVRRELEEMLAVEHHLEHTTLQVDHIQQERLTIGPSRRRALETIRGQE
jgi:cobalt-zinc-cadmium efflux system protein